MLVLVAGLVLFLGIHSVSIVAPRWRLAMVDRLGEWPWKGVYSIVSAVGLVVLVVGYGIDYAQRNRNLPHIGAVRFLEDA